MRSLTAVVPERRNLRPQILVDQFTAQLCAAHSRISAPTMLSPSGSRTRKQPFLPGSATFRLTA